MKKRTPPAPMQQWLADPLRPDVQRMLERLRRTEDVQQVAVMPDVHLGHGVCIGTAFATQRLIYPEAAGGDIGCGYSAVALSGSAAPLTAATARALLGLWQTAVPVLRHHAPSDPPWLAQAAPPEDVLPKPAMRDARVEFGTLGRGNHFLELQRDETGRLWLMVHSGSRCVGPAVRDWACAHSAGRSHGLQYLAADSESGRTYLRAAGYARAYAEMSRRLMLMAAADTAKGVLDTDACWDTYLRSDHNHIRREHFPGRGWLWVHRKGAAPARHGQVSLIPGSMAGPTVHVVGRGHEPALSSSSHGAGRRMSRERAQRQVTREALTAQMGAVHFLDEQAGRWLDEAPAAYRDLDAVLRAQRRLVREIRRLWPVVSFKG